MNNQIPAVKRRAAFGQSTVWSKHALHQEALNRMRRDLKRLGARRPAKQEQQKSINSGDSYCNFDFRNTIQTKQHKVAVSHNAQKQSTYSLQERKWDHQQELDGELSPLLDRNGQPKSIIFNSFCPPDVSLDLRKKSSTTSYSIKEERSSSYTGSSHRNFAQVRRKPSVPVFRDIKDTDRSGKSINCKKGATQERKNRQNPETVDSDEVVQNSSLLDNSATSKSKRTRIKSARLSAVPRQPKYRWFVPLMLKSELALSNRFLAVR